MAQIKIESLPIFSFYIIYDETTTEYQISTKRDTGVSIVYSADKAFLYLYSDNPDYPKPSLTGREAIEFLKLGQLLLDHQASLHPSVVLD